MKNIVIALLFVFITPLHAQGPTHVKILGEFIAPKHNNTLQEDYYFIYNSTQGGKNNIPRVFPISNKDKKTLEYINKNLGKLFVIQAKTLVKQKNLNELPMQVTYLEIDNIHTVELKDIRHKYSIYSNGFKYDQTQPSKRAEKIEFYEIEDSITNKFIYTSAALLIARALLGF
ncbi:MAG: hypothetical protein ACO20H_05155 [Bacteriovoracaceae bacterium]